MLMLHKRAASLMQASRTAGHPMIREHPSMTSNRPVLMCPWDMLCQMTDRQLDCVVVFYILCVCVLLISIPGSISILPP